MKDWKKVVVKPESSLRETIGVIDASALQIALVLDGEGRLIGTITDGDVRRGILRGLSLEDRADKIMNADPVVARANENGENILNQMKNRSIRQVPVVNEAGVLVGLEVLENLLHPPQRSNAVVLMAGGVGSRLQPLTNDCPKPLLKVGSKPILETILENFIRHGFRNFFLSVNYKAEMIQGYFGDGSRWGVEIRYLRETEKLGTAGALSLLPAGLKEPIFVMNGDLLTKVNASHLLAFHNEHKAKATICVRDYEFQVPYGVVKIDNHRLQAIEEKPVHQFFVNAGIYVLEPEAVEMIPRNCYYDMPTLFEQLIGRQHDTAVFPIREYWLDIGRVADFERANLEYGEIFS